MPVSNIFEIGKQSLLAYQSAIQTTAGNISNSNNENYARRRVAISQMLGGFSALGFNPEESVRMRQRFAEQQLWSENQSLNEYSTSNMLLSQIEDIYAEDTESGLSTLLSQFWNSWSDLANDPESDYARAIVKDKGLLLTNAFGRMHEDLKQMQAQIRPEIDSRISEVNQILQQISSINQKLRYENAPDLMDQRDQLLSNLSSELDIKVKEKETGEVSIYADGYLLVSDSTVNTLRTEVVNIDDSYEMHIYWGDSDKELNPGSGAIQGLLNSHNVEIPDHLSKLDQLAVQLADTVNGVHESGENLSGITNISFFDSVVTGAADFKVNGAILNDISLIATRQIGEGEGSGSIAQSISDLQYNKGMNGSTTMEFYHGILSQLGNKIQESGFLQQSQKLIVEQLQNQKESITGVSIDEEMTRLVQYEQAFQAASKIINTVDEMTTTLLNLK